MTSNLFNDHTRKELCSAKAQNLSSSQSQEDHARNTSSPTGRMPKVSENVSEIARFQNLFPEIPVRILHHGTKKKEGEEQSTAALEVPEVVTALLKTLVSLSRDCPQGASLILAVGASTARGERGPSNGSVVVCWAAAVLAWCASWRLHFITGSMLVGSSANRDSGKKAYTGLTGALSPNETMMEVCRAHCCCI
jgi:hypothetical protein